MLIKEKDKQVARTTLYIEAGLKEKLKKISIETGITLTELINEAIKEYIQKYIQQQEEQQKTTKNKDNK